MRMNVMKSVCNNSGSRRMRRMRETGRLEGVVELEVIEEEFKEDKEYVE